MLGPVEIAADFSRAHPGERTGALRLRTDAGLCVLKILNDPASWQREVHAYRRWAPAFGTHAPRLLAARQEPPRAVLLTALPGQILEELRLSPAQEQAIWRQAGAALPALHEAAVGQFFGFCQQDGTPAQAAMSDAAMSDAVGFVGAELEEWTRRGRECGGLTGPEQAVVAAAQARLSAFADEPALPCHRDYGPANWLVTDDGQWAGVIDFEFSRWDVRASDFTRYPSWEWLARPDLLDAFFDGYGSASSRPFGPADAQQRLICHVLYALSAVAWGRENEYFGFEREGHLALQKLAQPLGVG